MTQDELDALAIYLADDVEVPCDSEGIKVFARRLLEEVQKRQVPVAWHSKFHSQYGAFSRAQIYPDDVPLYKALEIK